ncbi:unnamed protein product [Symbiodinium sp. KB8]|nr:unnamed protein product [Symbiodinium sp. KB8]
MTKSKVIVCEHCETGWIYKPDRPWYPTCWHCGQAWKAQRTVQSQDDWGYWDSWWPQPSRKSQRQAQRAAGHRATQKFLSQQDEKDLSQDWDMSPPGLMGPQDDKYKEAAAALWEGAEPAAQRLLRAAGIPPPDEDQEVPPAKQISRCMAEYKNITRLHRTLIGKKIALQAKTEKIKQQFEAAVDQLTAVSSRIEAVEEQLMRAHAQIKEKVNNAQQPQITALSGLLKEAGIDLNKEQEGALGKLLATNKLEVADLWKTEPGVPGELLEGDWFGQERCCSSITPGHMPLAAQVLRRQVKARLRLWKRLREVLIHHLFIPEEEERTLITLAESEGVKDNEDGLEGWTAFQLMNKVSEGAKDGFEILTQAVEDIISNLSSKESRTIQIRSSNITQWRNEVQKWLQAQSDDIILVQETHLTKEGVTSAVAAMHKAGYEMFGGESAPSNKKGTYGGVAILSRTQFKARTVQHFTIEGCGFCAAEVRVKGVSLLLVSVYLKNSTPVQSHPNAEILGRLVALVRAHVGQWLVAGDFNLTPHELSATNILSEMRGHLLTVGEATAHGGNEIDFAITSYAISGLVQADLDWSAPHRPHASLRVQITMPRNTVTSLRLPEFSVKDAAENASLSEARPTVEAVTILNRCFRQDNITQDFATFSKWCQQAMYPDENTARGGSLAFVRKPVVQGQPLRRHSDQAGLWLRIESCVKISERAIEDVVSKLQFSTPSQECEGFRAEILALLTGSDRSNTALETKIREHIKQAQDEHLAQDKQRYHEWLEGAMVKGMRPST